VVGGGNQGLVGLLTPTKKGQQVVDGCDWSGVAKKKKKILDTIPNLDNRPHLQESRGAFEFHGMISVAQTDDDLV